MSLPSIIRKNKQVKDPKTGQITQQQLIFTNPAKSFVKPYTLLFSPAGNVDTFTIAAGLGVSGPVPMIIDDASGHFEAFYFMSAQTNPYTIMIKDEGKSCTLMNRPVHIDTIAGTAQRPFILPETYFLNVSGGNRQLTVEMSDISNVAGNAIRFAMHGRRFVFKEAPLEIFQKFQSTFLTRERGNVFFLTTQQPIATLVPGAANLQNFEFRMTSDAMFEAIKFTYATWPTGVPLDIRMWEYGSGRSFAPTLIRTDINNMFGSAQFPMIPAESYLFERDRRVVGEIVNTGALNCDVYLTITGRLIKYPEEVMR